MSEERRSGRDRRSAWNEALWRLHRQDAFLQELDGLLMHLLERADAADVFEIAYQLRDILDKYRGRAPGV